jgi:hypothetical protein
MMIACQHCGHAVASEAKHCPSCGGVPAEHFRPISTILFTLLAIGAALYYNLQWLAALAIFLPVIRYGIVDHRLRRQRDLLNTPKGPWRQTR